MIAYSVRLAIAWTSALALLLQISLAAISPPTGEVTAGSLTDFAFCHSADQSAPVDTKDRVIPHIKCIACVLVHSLPPTTHSATLQVALAWTDGIQTWPRVVLHLVQGRFHDHAVAGLVVARPAQPPV
jgi:hypothetical protein